MAFGASAVTTPPPPSNPKMSAQMLIQLKAENEALKARVAEREAAKEIAALMAENAALKAQLGEDDEVTIVEDAPAPPKKEKKEKKPAGEKRPPSAWCNFSARVVKIIRASGWTGPQTLIWTVAAQVKNEKGYDCTDADIMSAWEQREPPALDTEVAPKKVKKPQSEETKAAAALKRAATKAAKAAAAPEPEAAPKKAVKKPKAKVDLALDLVGEEDSQYYTNQRGDCVSTHGEWLGHWTGTTIDTSAPEPADFDTLQLRQ